MEASQIKRKRGRPPRDTKNDTSEKPVIKTETRAVRALRIPSRPFFACLSGTAGARLLSFVDRKGKPVRPDYRTFIGVERDLVRAFSAELNRSASLWSWEAPSETAAVGILQNPSDALIDLAVAAKALFDESFEPFQLIPGDFSCAIQIEDIGAAKTKLSSVLVNRESGETLYPASKKLDPITQTFVRDGNTLYKVEPLGPWFERITFSSEIVSTEQVEAWLSLARSLVPSLKILAEAWNTRVTRPITAHPALFFSEIDVYGFLHVRPIVYLEGYPPGFFEDQEIVEIVRLDHEEKTIRISEVLFPENPCDIFRALLAKAKGRSASIYEENDYFVLEGAFAKEFLEENMLTLMQRFVLLQSSVLEKYLLRINRPRLKMSLGLGMEAYFTGSAEVSIGGETLPFGVFMDQYRKQGFITLSDGSRAWPEKDTVERFDRLLDKVKGSDDAVSVSFFDLPALHETEGIEGDGEGWQQVDMFLRGFNSMHARPVNTSLPNASLRPYQEYGVKWLEYLREHKMGACLADEMGLGKTVQIIVALRNAYAQGMTGKSLILVPRSLIFNWKAEFARFAPEIPVLIHYGNQRDLSLIKKTENAVILSSYATLRNDIKELLTEEFAYVVLDEAQNVKNIETKTSVAVRGLRAQYRVAMSGTPVENSLGDLYSLFRFINPSFFGSEAAFARDYLRPIQEQQNENALRDLKRRLYPFMLRRTKKDVLKDLPEKTEQTALIELSADHLALYRQRSGELKARITLAIETQGLFQSTFLVLQALTELRRLAGVPEASGDFSGHSAKREYLRETIGAIVAEGHKCLVFTNFLATVELVSEDLAALGIGNLVMTGATVNRQALVEQFQSDPSIGVFIMTLKTGGVGLNLTAADYVFILDPWWNRAAEQQAIDRTHRIGQVNPVFCYRMIAKDTIEERILELQTRKAGLAEALLESDSGAIKKLSEDDIEYLLG